MIKFSATLKKLSANMGDKMDSLQFQLDEDQMEANGEDVIVLRRFQNVSMRVADKQAHMSQSGAVEFFEIAFQAMAISISICVTDTGQICTITISTENRDAFDKCIQHHLRERVLDLYFTDGENPFKQKK
jgi:hypothetical protein